ncbi:hypothetical protein JAMAL_19 [Mycobacterium phage JAMaL]|uniref:Uncharacterized protein n=1 Tax=Mycobacterium phage JAMaL TaxID=1429905 RepID=V5UNJ0_9CAUD|nr:hypothetical protein CH22_gp19 [Mycobacterium phage JAMaL]AHB79339.1 hypothetical protein JAMAL_19 [Mycobacterium phage JAMaL]
MSTLAAAALEYRIREAVAHTGSPVNEVRMARAILSVHATDDVVVALGAAARLEAQGILPHQVRTLYGNGYSCHKLVNEAVAAAS